MKNKHFYSHIITTTDITLKLSEMDLTEEEKNHLESLLEANIHSVVVETILSELSNDDKKQFLQNLVSDNHQITLEHLKLKINNVENKITDSIENLKKELLDDLEEAKKLAKENHS